MDVAGAAAGLQERLAALRAAQADPAPGTVVAAGAAGGAAAAAAGAAKLAGGHGQRLPGRRGCGAASPLAGPVAVAADGCNVLSLRPLDG